MSRAEDGDRAWLEGVRQEVTSELQRAEDLRSLYEDIAADMRLATDALERTTQELEAIRSTRAWRLIDAMRSLKQVIRRRTRSPQLEQPVPLADPAPVLTGPPILDQVSWLDEEEIPADLVLIGSPGVVPMAVVRDGATRLVAERHLSCLAFPGVELDTGRTIIPALPLPGRHEVPVAPIPQLVLAKSAALGDTRGRADPATIVQHCIDVAPGSAEIFPDVAFAIGSNGLNTGHSPARGKARTAAGATPRTASIIIPTRDQPDLLAAAVQTVEEACDALLEVIIVDNGSSEPATLEYLAASEHTVVRHEGGFNFPDLIAAGARRSKADALILLNDDISATDRSWARALLDCLQATSCGVAGSLLLYPDHRIQHVGLVIEHGEPVHALAGLLPEDAPLGILETERECSAVTGACLAIRSSTWDLLRGMDHLLAQNYNDVDLCFRARARRLGTIVTPAACLNHHESASRGTAWNPQVASDRVLFRGRWHSELKKPDPFWPRNIDTRLGHWHSAHPDRSKTDNPL